MNSCVDCRWFKMLKNWQYAYCSMGQLIKENGKNRKFLWLTGDKYSSRTLVERGYHLRSLQNHNCFESIDSRRKI